MLAVSAFRKAGWVEEPPGLASRWEIEVREHSVKHTHTGAASAMGEWSRQITGREDQASADAAVG